MIFVGLDAFEKFKERLNSLLVLALPPHEKVYSLDTDAREYQVEGVFLQPEPNGDNLPVGYWSKSLSVQEYFTEKMVCLAVVWSTLRLRLYLYRATFTLRTAHHALKWILNVADSSGRLASWRSRLVSYDYGVEYRPWTTPNVVNGL